MSRGAVALTLAAIALLGACKSGRQPVAATLGDLPLIEVDAAKPRRVLAVLMTGDGGWAAGDKGLSAALATRGVPVVGLSAPRYLAQARTPDEASRDLARIVSRYESAWKSDSIIVIGYSRGADVVPFMVSRLPSRLRRDVALVVLLGPSRFAGLEFHPVDLVANVHRPGDLSVAPEVERLRGTPVLCIYGRRDRDAICPLLDSSTVRPVVRNGGHEVGGSEGPALADTILSALARAR
jgi:type IV secretory pathway VirJ component